MGDIILLNMLNVASLIHVVMAVEIFIIIFPPM